MNGTVKDLKDTEFMKSNHSPTQLTYLTHTEDDMLILTVLSILLEYWIIKLSICNIYIIYMYNKMIVDYCKLN